MRKGKIKLIGLSILFVISVIVISKIYNRGSTSLTTTMKEATYPIAYFRYDDQPVNYLHGYTNEMEANYMRDSLILIDENRELPLVVKNYNVEIKNISFEVRSLDTTRLIEATEVKNYKENNGTIDADLTIKNLLEENQEYILVLILQTEEDTIHYYTRIRQETTAKLEDMSKLFAFVQDFHSWTLDTGKEEQILKYLEPNASGNNSSFHYVDIHSNVKQVTFGDMDIRVLDHPRISIKEQNPIYGVFTIEYTATLVSDNGDTQYYNIVEYYRVKAAGERIYLLNFNRSMEEIFVGDNHIIDNGKIQLGIGNEEIEYKGNEKGTVVCFVKEGDLWSYNQDNQRLTKIFGFRSGEGIHERENWQQYNINIINVDEGGSIDFLVYGYMNRGNHEGEVGILVYHFDSVNNTIEEEVFIPSRKSYQVMKEEVGDLLFVNEDNELFVILNEVFYKINLNTREVEILVENIQYGCYVTSKDGKMVSWLTENEINRSREIKVLNLSNGNEYSITADGKEYLRPLGFMGTDLVYGVAREEDIVSDITGNTIFPMYSIKIVNEEKEVVKEYKREGCYVESAQIEGNVINLNRVSKGDTVFGYIGISADQIMNNRETEEKKIQLHTTVTELKATQVQIAMEEEITNKNLKVLTPKEVLLKEERTIEISDKKEEEYSYLVYAKGGVISKTNQVSNAVKLAQEQIGVVIGNNQQYIWERGNLQVRTKIEGLILEQTYTSYESLGVCLRLMCEKKGATVDAQKLLEEGKTVLSILNEYVDADILSLSGCSIEEILYYVSEGNPVIAMKDKEHAVLIIGYDELNITVLDPVTGTSYKIGLNDSREMFESAGNVFVSYIN